MEEFKNKIRELDELKEALLKAKAEKALAEAKVVSAEEDYLALSKALVVEFQALGIEEIKVDGKPYKVRKAIEGVKVLNKEKAKAFAKSKGLKWWVEVTQVGTIKSWLKKMIEKGEETPDFFSFEYQEYVKAGKGAK